MATYTVSKSGQPPWDVFVFVRQSPSFFLFFSFVNLDCYFSLRLPACLSACLSVSVYLSVCFCFLRCCCCCCCCCYCFVFCFVLFALFCLLLFLCSFLVCSLLVWGLGLGFSLSGYLYLCSQCYCQNIQITAFSIVLLTCVITVMFISSVQNRFCPSRETINELPGNCA